LRSTSNQFAIDADCVLCGYKVALNKGRGSYHRVTSDAFAKNILESCRERKDDWAYQVEGRIEFLGSKLISSMYHDSCHGHFRCGRQMPSAFRPNDVATTPETKKLKPSDSQVKHESRRQAAFSQIHLHLENSFENALSISQLKDEFNQSLPADCSPASNRDIKNNLRATFGDRVKFVIRKGCIADSVVLEKASPERLNNKEDEILRAAAELIVADIKKLPKTGKDTYTNTETLEGCSLAHVPTTLLKFLRILLVEKDDKKLSAIGQAIVHVSRPRSYLAPIQMGLAIELHAMFRSRFLVETLHALGFCSS
jgi:hypothetical protein